VAAVRARVRYALPAGQRGNTRSLGVCDPHETVLAGWVVAVGVLAGAEVAALPLLGGFFSLLPTGVP
jgi:hypothetical protein